MLFHGIGYQSFAPIMRHNDISVQVNSSTYMIDEFVLFWIRKIWCPAKKMSMIVLENKQDYWELKNRSDLTISVETRDILGWEYVFRVPGEILVGKGDGVGI